ncbi:hypothetical protein [Aquiflexum sp.]|uniref:hypothetical protein n=1 Tax=Aquiflexum sp. TaxID=1872584 RepID=UPI0035947220
MKRLTLVFLLAFSLGSGATVQSPDIWALLSKTRFIEKLNREHGMYFLYPIFPDELKELEGKSVQVTGFYIPLDVSTSDFAVLSKFPNAECFFCGGAGPESIVVAYLKKKPSKRIKVDEIITIKGKLKLNDTDIDDLNFILLDAEIVD